MSVLIIVSVWAGASVAATGSPVGSSATGAVAAQETTTQAGTTTGETVTETATTRAGTTDAGQVGNARFANNTVAEDRGDVAQFTVTLEGADGARVRIGSRAVNYLAVFTVVDADGDGQVTVNYDTFVAGQDATASGITATGGDEIRNYRLVTEPLASPLDAASYDLSLSVGGTETDVGTLTLNERSTGEARTWIAPADADAESAAAIRQVVTRNRTLAQGDLAIVEVEASGLYGYVDEMDDLNNASTGLSFTVTETDLGPNEIAQNASLENATLVTDSASDRFFVVIDTSDLEANNTYEATFRINDSNPLLAEGEVQNASTTFTVQPRRLTFDSVTEDGVVQVPAGSGRLSGTTTLAPGSEFTVELRSTGASPFLDRQTVTVAPDGTWNATFDLNGAEPGTEFEVIVEEFDLTRTGVVVEAVDADAQANETTTVSEPAATTTAATTTAATTEEGTTETTTA